MGAPVVKKLGFVHQCPSGWVVEGKETNRIGSRSVRCWCKCLISYGANDEFVGSRRETPVEREREEVSHASSIACYYRLISMAFSFKKVFSSLQSSPALAQSAVGVDIGRSAVKVVELERNEEAPILKTYGEIHLGPYAEQPVGSVVDFDIELLKKAIVDVLRESGVSARHGTLSLPLSTGFVTVIQIVTPEGEEIASRIPVEARKYVPLPLQEITLDWAPVGAAHTNERGETVQSVLLVALQNESVISFKTLLDHIELPQQPMELAMFSASRALDGAAETVALVDVGAAVSKLYIYESGTLAGIHRFTAGGAQVTTKLAELMSVDVAAAEEIKRSAADADTIANVKRVTTAVFDASLQEIRRIIQQYETSHNVTDVPVVLSGGVVNTGGFEQYVSDVLQRPASRAFPFATVGYPAFMEDVLRDIGPTFMNSLGAALRHVR